MIRADDIAGCLARSTFKDALVVVDRCLELGDECDLLVIDRHSLRYIDVEVKVSRADLKADRRKDKWFERGRGWYANGERPPPVPRDWPRKVWKHYYAMPAAIWKDDLLAHCGAKSGVLLVTPNERAPRHWKLKVVRRATPCREAVAATPHEVLNIARLASLRMWDSYAGAQAPTPAAGA